MMVKEHFCETSFSTEFWRWWWPDEILVHLFAVKVSRITYLSTRHPISFHTMQPQKLGIFYNLRLINFVACSSLGTSLHIS